MSNKLKTNVICDIEFKKFKYEFLSSFIFKPIERPNFNQFIKVHYQACSIIYKKIYSVIEYSEIVIKENPIEFKNYGIELKTKPIS